MLKSQEMRKLAPEMDPLRIGTGWKKEDLEKPQIMVESTYGDSHPGSGHLNLLVEEVRKGVAEAGGFGARYFCTDICDGESQGTDGINYSLASREMIANMIEIHANATPFDGGVYLSSCDKGMPGNLIGLARVDIPAVVVPGGTMNAGPEMLTLEQLGMYSAKFERGEIDEEKLDWAKCNACPSCGACSFIGTASTMQIMAEALGLALPGSALMPATSPDLLAYAQEAGSQAVKLAQMEHMRPSDLVTKESFENAILVHAAISGSTNCLLHIPAIAHEFGIEITGDTFDRLHRNARYLLDVRPAGRWPAECFYYAGGVPAIMEEIKDHLHLDVMTVTGKTLVKIWRSFVKMDFMRSAADGSQNSMSGMELRLQKKILSARMTRRSERTAASLFCAETLRRREPSSSTRPARKKCSTPSSVPDRSTARRSASMPC